MKKAEKKSAEKRKDQENRVEIPSFARSAMVKRNSYNPEDRTVEVEYTTGARVYRPGWFGEAEYFEELSTEPGHVRLDRIKGGSCPVLRDHYSGSLNFVLGTVLDGDETHARCKMSQREDVKGFVQDIEDGVINNISVGYRVYRYKDVSTDDDEIRVLRAIDWEPIEISFVPIGADPAAGVRSDLKTNPCLFSLARDSNKTGDKSMKKDKESAHLDTGLEKRNEEENAAASTEADAKEEPKEAEAQAEEKSSDVSEEAERSAKKAVKAERKRVSEIRSLVRSVGLDEQDATEMIESGESLDQARAKVLDKLAAQSDENPTHSVRVHGGGCEDKQVRNAAIEKAIMARENPSIELEGLSKEYRGLSLIDICREILGHRETRGLSKREIAHRAFHSTSDFTEILANVANKTLRSGYDNTARNFMSFARQGSLADFKEAKRIALSNASNLEVVSEGGEYKRGTFTDGAETIQLSTYGKILSITREAIINDDLSAFARIPSKLGAAAARLENSLVFDILSTNPVMADGTALFHADHNNLTDALLGITGLGALRTLLRTQTDPSGNDYLNLPFRTLIVPAALETAAEQLQARILENEVGKVNPFKSSFEIVVEPNLDATSTTHYYGVTDPAACDTIEYAYLEGESGPYIETRTGFERDGMEIKVRHDFAAKAIDHRGMTKSTNDAS